MTKTASKMSAAAWCLLASLCGTAASAAVAPLDSRSVAEISAALQAPVSVSYSRATGAVRFVRVAPGALADLAPGAGSLEGRARSFFAAQGAMFGIRDAAAELFLTSSTTDKAGQQHLTFSQFFRGVPVFAGLLRAHFDAAGRLQTVNGNFVPGIDLKATPDIDGNWASRRAIDSVRERNGLAAAAAAGLSASQPSLVVYRLGLDKGVAGENLLAWKFEVSNAGEIREFVFVDARYGKVVDVLPGVNDAMNRRAFLGTDGNADNVPDAWPASPDWLEGNPIPSGIQERDNMLISSGDVYTRFFNAFGRDSYDAAGHVMDQAYNRNYACPNASWNGNLISFCPGFTTHDVTAHEWGHAYTEYTHGLIYRWQPGALNEAYSDMWGEAFDLETALANMVDTDAPDVGRTAAACSTFTVLPPTVLINTPPSIAGPKLSGTAAFGPQSFSLTNDLVLADDGVLGTGTLSDGCCAGPTFVCAPNSWTNAAAINGKIAVIDRGVCPFAVKVKNAQDQGAVGVMIANNQGGTAIINMSGVDATITIPALSVTQNDGAAIKTEMLSTTVNASLSRGASGTDPSIRWLMGEDVTPGGSLRDMWNPTCYSNPGKVTDTLQYVCGTGDNGGVHTNSGIPNHAFALLVDGGTYNSVTVAPIGLVKTIHLIYRAQSVYQVPTSDFADHADAMEASCNDLQTAATALNDPWGGPTQTMTAGDCTAVADAMLAVQMRTEPTFCNFTTLLAQNPPAICATGFPYATNLFDWEGGAAGWTVSRRGVVNPATFLPRDWTIDATLPGGRLGSAFSALDPVAGDCTTDDETGALVLESPTFSMPFAGAVPRLTFDHYVASEATWDGGNVKISVNGGPYTVIPPSAFSFNPQTGALTGPGTNTDPLAGEQAWHGTDGGAISGTWGRTIGNLTGIVAPGQNFKLRYEFGSDGCGGTTLGWWVDDVQIYTCETADALFLDGFELATSGRWSVTAP